MSRTVRFGREAALRMESNGFELTLASLARSGSGRRSASFRGAGGATRGAAAVEGAIVLRRAERHPGRGSRSAAELDDVIVSALP
jgi:hypothetical protein